MVPPPVAAPPSVYNQSAGTQAGVDLGLGARFIGNVAGPLAQQRKDVNLARTEAATPYTPSSEFTTDVAQTRKDINAYREAQPEYQKAVQTANQQMQHEEGNIRLDYGRRLADQQNEETQAEELSKYYANPDDVVNWKRNLESGTPAQKKEASEALRAAQELSSDPFRDSGARRILAALAAFAGGVSSAINKTPNYALQVIQDYAAADVRKQLANKNNASNRLLRAAEKRGIILNDQDKEMYRVNVAHQRALSNAATIIEGARGKIEASDKLLKVDEVLEGVKLKQADLKTQNLGLLMQGTNAATDNALQAAAQKYQFDLDTIKANQPTGKQAPTFKYFSFDDPNQAAALGTPELMKVNTKVVFAKLINDDINRLQEIINKSGGDIGWVSANRDTIDQIAANITSNLRKAQEAGAAFSPQEIEMSTKAAGLASVDRIGSAVRGDKTVLKQLDQGKANMRNMASELVGSVNGRFDDKAFGSSPQAMFPDIGPR
jgi:hypothetical protein